MSLDLFSLCFHWITQKSCEQISMGLLELVAYRTGRNEISSDPISIPVLYRD